MPILTFCLGVLAGVLLAATTRTYNVVETIERQLPRRRGGVIEPNPVPEKELRLEDIV